MQKLLPLCAALLASCATTQVTSGIEKRDVQVPVSVGCVQEKDLPTWPVSQMREESDIAALSSGAKLYVKELRRVAREQRVLLRACLAGQTQPETR